jgi:hypothetical protein
MKNKRLFSFIFAILLIAVSACSSAAGRNQLMQDGLSKLEKVSSIVYDLNVGIWQDGSLVQVMGEGQYKNPDQSYLKLTSVGTNFEILSLSLDKTYMKDPASGNWQPISSSDLAQSGFSANYFQQQLELLKAYDQPKLIGSEEIDGVKCSHIQFEISSSLLSEVFLRSILTGAKDLTGLQINGEIWIGKQDALTRKSVVEINIGQAYKMTTTLTYKEFNSEITFPIP